MDYKKALNKRLALVLWAEDEEGEDDVVVFSGIFIQDKGNYYLQREGNEPNPEIRKEWLSRIKVVPEDLKDIFLNCEYQLPLSVGDAEETSGSMESFGLKWPDN